jgi:DNA mismatch repair protein MutH
MERPTLAAIQEGVKSRIGESINCPITANKGAPGILLEKLTGVPTSSALLDALDGELKMVPYKLLKNGTLVPKETMAVTMLNCEQLSTTAFGDSHCGTKLRRMLIVPYVRDGDNIRLLKPTLFDASDACNQEVFAVLTADYAAIQNEWNIKKELHSKTGTLLQTRTKGPGGTAKKTKAFYLRKVFMKKVVTLE